MGGDKMFLDDTEKYYVYEWYIIDTGEVFYVGKGTGDRCKEHKRRNKMFLDFYNTHDCTYRIIKNNLNEKDAFDYEKELIEYYRTSTNYRLSNVLDGGYSDTVYRHYTEEQKLEWRKRSSLSKKGIINQKENNPMYGKSYLDGKTEEEKQVIREKQRISNLGKKRTLESRKKMSESAKKRECKLPPAPCKSCAIIHKETKQIMKIYDKIGDAYNNEFGVKGNLSRKAKGLVKNDKEIYQIVYLEDLKNYIE